MAGRVDIASKRVKKGEVVANELVGIPPPEPFVHALWGYTARAEKMMASLEKEAIHKTAAPAASLARKIKAASLFPSIYDGAKSIGPNA